MGIRGVGRILSTLRTPTTLSVWSFSNPWTLKTNPTSTLSSYICFTEFAEFARLCWLLLRLEVNLGLGLGYYYDYDYISYCQFHHTPLYLYHYLAYVPIYEYVSPVVLASRVDVDTLWPPPPFIEFAWLPAVLASSVIESGLTISRAKCSDCLCSLSTNWAAVRDSSVVEPANANANKAKGPDDFVFG